MKAQYFALSFLLAVSVPFIAYADDVTDAIDEGLSHYEDGKLSEAAGQLEYAATLIRQQRAEGLKTLFPAALSGWEASEVQAGSAGIMGGGMISGSRDYHKSDAGVEISLAMDSPMLQGLLMMFNNPTYAAMGGGKLTKVKGEKAIIKNEGNDFELMFVLNGKILVTVKGTNASEADVMAYAEALDFDKVSKF